MRSSIYVTVGIFISTIACRQYETKSLKMEQLVVDDLNERSELSDSFSIFKVIEKSDIRKKELGIKLQLTDADFEKVEEIVEPILLNNDKDNLVIVLQKEKLITLQNISDYHSLYFYGKNNEEGEKRLLKHFEYHLTPMDSYVVAIFENEDTNHYIYASNLGAMKTKCFLEKKAKIPDFIKSQQPKESEVQYFTCRDKSFQLVSFYTEFKCYLYFINDNSKLDLVYKASGSNIIVDITPLPFFINDKPILYVSLENNDGDYIEEKLMIFSRRQYEIIKGNKIGKNNI